MSVMFSWYPATQAQSCELVWSSGAVPIKCDEIRFLFVSAHVGMDNVYSGKLVARLSYFEKTSNKKITVTPTLRVMVGDQSKPSKFTIQGILKLGRPINIASMRRMELTMGPFPIVAEATQSVSVTQKWGFMSYFLQGNEISG